MAVILMLLSVDPRSSLGSAMTVAWLRDQLLVAVRKQYAEISEASCDFVIVATSGPAPTRSQPHGRASFGTFREIAP